MPSQLLCNMKISLSLFCLLFICFIATSFQSKRVVLALPDWVTYQIDNQFSVQMPVQPTEIDLMKLYASQGVTPPAEQLETIKSMKLLTATDGITNYMITRTPIGIEANINEPSSRTAFYDGAINGLMRNERGSQLQRSIFSTGGAEGVELSYKGVHKVTGKMVVKYNRFLAADKMLYMVSVYPVDKNDSTGITLKEQRTKFFNSVAYKPNAKLSK